MGAGIDWMVGVAQWVASLPGSVGHMAAFGTGPLLLVTLGLLLICLLRTPLRWSGAPLIIAASLWALNVPRPDVLVASDGQLAAVRGSDGRLALLHNGRDAFALKEWLAADGDPRKPTDASLRAGVHCDRIGCTAKLADGRPVAYALSAEAFGEDCARAAAVISPRQAPLACRAPLIDRPTWRAQGSTALYWNGAGFDVEVVRPIGTDRPWARNLATSAITADDSGTAPTSRRPAAPDATPRQEDLEADD